MKIDASERMYSEIRRNNRPLAQRRDILDQADKKVVMGNDRPHSLNPALTHFPPVTTQPNPIFMPMQPNPGEPSHTACVSPVLVTPEVKPTRFGFNDPIIKPIRNGDCTHLEQVA